MKPQDSESGFSRFDFLFLIPGIATGMATANVLQFFGELIAHNAKEPPSLIHILWLVALLIFVLQHWYYILDWREKDVIKSFGQYVLSFLFPAGTYIMSVLLCPNHEDAAFDALGSLIQNRGHLIYLAGGATMLVAAVEGEAIERRGGLKFAYARETLARSIAGVLFIGLGLAQFGWRHTAAAVLLVVSGAFRLLMGRSSPK